MIKQRVLYDREYFRHTFGKIQPFTNRDLVRGGATQAMAPGVFEKLLSKNDHFRKFQKIVLLVAPPVSNPNVVPGFGTNKPNPSSTSSLDTLASIESSYVHLHKLKYLSAWRNLQANVPSFFFGALISEVIEWSSLRIRDRICIQK